MKTIAKIALAAAALSITPVAVAQSDPMAKYRKKLMERGEADYARAVTVLDDDMETIAIISTERAGRTKGHIPMGEGDVMLRAGINKETGATLFQITASIGYWGDWRFYSLGSYSTPAGPVGVTPRVISRDVITCMAGCKYQETVAVDVDIQTLELIAASGEPWRFRFQGRGPVWNEEMNPAEVKALLAAVSRYKAGRGLS
ncbi:hypothetical protein [Sphingopyxis sp. YF1]|uniref:hypothetical protein n=1 Tax=Sphingopyxis sp. YF1 TaxID=2482763 RepID=UPI001F61687B|nr:hypothetical protein [Sphingopyxis sp. YF1]